ncbi:hypothetical protein [Burkholderia cepacia]|uniref:hypothetical protein n=1 Tax=Burkholderia cepacia TaxID=292 RepID=UPI000AA074C1|nr:hypothetical protein [Burkholderia cepacia]
MAGNLPRTASRTPAGGAKTTTKTKAEGTALPVVHPFDLWYLCEKAVYAKRNPYRRARDGRPMYQRKVTKLVRLDNAAFEYHWPYCSEVGYDMHNRPPTPIMSGKPDQKWRPSEFPLSYYKQITSKALPGYSSVEVERDLLGKDELELLLALPLPPDAETRGIWTDVQGGVRGLLRIPDVVRLHTWSNPSEAQYSQLNLACVIEMKFPGDTLRYEQQEAYRFIAGDPDKFRLLHTSRCEIADKRLRRDWMRAAQKEPVYKPVSGSVTLRLRASADSDALLVGQIDAEHDLARRQLEVKPPAPGTPMMSALPDSAEVDARRRQAVAQIETALAAPFVAAGTAMLAIVAAPSAAVGGVEGETTVTAQAGAKVIQFERYLRVARTAGSAGAAAGAADKLAAQPVDVPTATSTLSAEQERRWNAYMAWLKQQEFKPDEERHYLFWPDAPRSTP